MQPITKDPWSISGLVKEVFHCSWCLFVVIECKLLFFCGCCHGLEFLESYSPEVANVLSNATAQARRQSGHRYSMVGLY